MGSKNSKRFDNKTNSISVIDSITHIEFNKVERTVKKEPSNLSNGLASEMSDLIIDDVLTVSDSNSLNSSDNQAAFSDVENETNQNENDVQKLKVVRFNDKVMVISCSDVNRFDNYSNKPGQNLKIVRIYFIALKDDKYSKKKTKLKFEATEETHPTIGILDIPTEFNQLRSYSMVKENTFYGETANV